MKHHRSNRVHPKTSTFHHHVLGRMLKRCHEPYGNRPVYLTSTFAPLQSFVRNAGITHFLLLLESIHNRRELGEDFICLLVELELCGNEVGEIA